MPDYAFSDRIICHKIGGMSKTLWGPVGDSLPAMNYLRPDTGLCVSELPLRLAA